MGDIRRIMQAVQDTPWAITPTKLAQIGAVLLSRAEAGSFPSASEIQAVDAAAQKRTRTQGAVAVIPLYGTISKRMGMLEAMSGGASLETFRAAFDAALADPEVGSIVLDIDSPGGSVYGVDEVAAHIYANRDTKRIIAVANGLAASAAYYIASAAGEFVASPSSEVGSIGVYTVHFDWSENLAAEGIKPTIISYGENKTAGNAFEPLADEAGAHIQSIVQDYGVQFERAVARNRGVSVKVVRSQFGRGRTFTAKRALERGMVDRVASLEQTIEDAARGRKVGATKRAALSTGEGAVLASLQTLQDAVLGGMTVDPAGGALADTEALLVKACQMAVVEDLVPSAEGLEALETLGVDRHQPFNEFVAETLDQIAGGLHLPEHILTAAAGGAAPDPETAPTEPAPVAMEDTVDPKDTAAQSGAATLDAEKLIAAERERSSTIRALGAQHGVDTAKVEQWVEQGATVDAVQGAILQDIQERAAAAVVTPSASVQMGEMREALRPFESLGHQLQAIAAAGSKGGGPVDPRLHRLNEAFAGVNPDAAAGMGSHTGYPSDGGFVVQDDFASGIVTKVWDEGNILSRTNRVPIGPNSNALKRNVLKENSRKTGYRYGGVRVYRAAEADTVAPSRPKLDQQRIELEKLMGIYYATEETIQDAVALTVEAERGFRRELTFVAENEVFRGTGAGQMLGFLNSKALVVVPKEGSQQAGTINVANVSKMMARLPATSLPTAAWFYNISCWPQLVELQIGNQPVFVPGGNIAGAPFGTLFGIPMFPVEYAAALGQQADMMLVDLSEYTTIDKRGVRWAESIHVRFIYDESAFRITYRINGQPDWPDSVEPFQGTDKISPFIALGERT